MDINSWEIVESTNTPEIDENIQHPNDNKLKDDKKEENEISHLNRSSSYSRYGQNVKNYE